jgi:SagB-type dehydrogenase family enzyme
VAGVGFSAVLRRRRSVREYVDEPLSRAEVGELLWSSQGISSPDGLRTAPSAGAIYPLTVHVALPDGLYDYRSAGHRVERKAASDVRRSLGEAAFGQEWVGRAPAVFAISGDVSKTAEKYADRAERYVFLEAGHAAQNLLLQAVALGLSGVPVGAFDDETVAGLLHLPGSQRPIYLLPVGRPAT